MKKETIRFDETVLEDAKFVAKYLGKSTASYIRGCVRMENQKRLKNIQKRIDEEIHVNTLACQPLREGNANESKTALCQLIRQIVEETITTACTGDEAIDWSDVEFVRIRYGNEEST